MARKEHKGKGKAGQAGSALPFGGVVPGTDLRTALAAAVRHHRAGRLREAQAVYQRVLEIQPDNADALSLMGLLTHQAGRNDVAADYLRRALALRPDFAEAHLNLGNVLRELGRLDEAVGHYQRAVEIKPGFAGAYNNLGLAMQEQGKLDRSVEYFEKALLVAPGFADAHNNLGLTLQKQGRLDAAVGRYRKALSLDPGFAEAHNNLGTALKEQGRPGEALECYRAALAIRADYVDAHINLAAALQEEGKADAAVAEYQKALALGPDSPELHNSLATAYEGQGQLDTAVAHYEKAIAIDPDYAEAHINLGNALREEGRYDDAITHYEKALAIRPDYAAARIDLGVALQEQGRLKDAIEQYERALTLKSDYAEAYRNLGIAHLELGEHEKARSAFHDVLRLNHGGAWWNAERFVDVGEAATGAPVRGLRASTFKLEDASDQIDYLIAKGLLDASFADMAARYRAVRDEVGAAVGRDGTATLNPEQAAHIGGFYNKVVRFADAPRLAGAAVNDALDFAAIEESYLSSPLSITTFDDFLTPAALAGLRDFCLESTIFFGYSGARFVGSDLGTGFNCSLLYQIAEELKERLPRILGAHELSNIWAYRHRNRSVGVEAHSDQGQVTFNFWISPATANRNPEHGGLLVYAKEQPYDWDWRVINRYKYRPDILKQINDFLESAETITIPYGENRAVLFHSNLFHKSDAIDFADGYTNRRMNVTMLFGKRGAG
ncbi:MAG: tetratricopeptide repeat protein, partial [Alphaproteobacteria bacterium]